MKRGLFVSAWWFLWAFITNKTRTADDLTADIAIWFMVAGGVVILAVTLMRHVSSYD